MNRSSSSSSLPRPRVMILGSSGRLGQALANRLHDDFVVTGIGRGEMDLKEPDAIAGVLERLEHDVLILPAALTAVDHCESHPDEAYAVNGEAPGVVAEICARKKVRMIHISTDFVFDGCKEGAYTEEDAPNPVSVYGASKLAGEQAVLASSPRNLVARVSWLYGPGRPAFPEWIIGKACEESTLALPEDKWGSPTMTGDLAGLLAPLLDNDDAAGILHLCNSGACSWREWGQFCLDTARQAGVPVQTRTITGNTLADVPAFVAKRPPNSALDTRRYTSLTGISPRPWSEALREHLLEQF